MTAGTPAPPAGHAAVTVVGVQGLPELRPGDDLVALLGHALRTTGLVDDDVVVVTSKAISKVEGRLVGDADRDAVVARETVRVVARRDDLVIAETAHGFVCANAGVDASNLDAGMLALLPHDPDASAVRLRSGLRDLLGVDLAVVVTDTFGRAWRRGVVNVAIGCAGLASIVDLRGRPDDRGRPLESTEVALADEIAAASGLVMGKGSRIPVAIVRGLDRPDAPDAPALELVRPAGEDLFRTSPMQALRDRSAARSFGTGDLPVGAVAEAIAAALAATALHQSPAVRFTVLASPAARRVYLAAIAGDRRDDDALAAAPVLIVPWLSREEADAPATEERDASLLAGGAAIEHLLLGLSAQGLAGAWVGSSAATREGSRRAIGMDEGWDALGTVACGPASV